MMWPNVAVTLRVTSPSGPMDRISAARRIDGSLPINANLDVFGFPYNTSTRAMPHHAERDGYFGGQR